MTTVPTLGDGLRRGPEARPGPTDDDERVTQVVRSDGEPFGLVLLPSERADGDSAVEGLVRDLGDEPASPLDLLHGAVGTPAPAEVDPDDHR